MPKADTAALTAALASARQTYIKTNPASAAAFEGDPLCTAEKSECIHRAFNDDGTTRVQELTLAGKGHSVLTLDFVDTAGHPTRAALENVIQYFSSRLRPTA